MSTYLVLFKVSGSAPAPAGGPTPADHQAWLDWKNDVADAIVDFGGPTRSVPGSGGDVVGYSIVRADSDDALDAVFETNPHRRQGGILEFHEIVEMAGG